MSTTESALRKLGFFRVFQIELSEDDRLSVVTTADARKDIIESCSPMIYLWASPIERFLEALYVGKAGLGVSRRMREHKQGFQHSQTGRKNRDNLYELLKSDRTVYVYARISETTPLLGIRAVNLYSAEEEAAAEVFAPRWNRAVFASARGRAANLDNRDRNSASRSKVGIDDGPLVLAGIDCSRIVHAALLRSFYLSLGAKDQHRLSEIISWLRSASTSVHLELKIVRGYSGMPSGFNGLPTLVVAELDDAGRAKHNAWVARIPLKGDEATPFLVLMPKRKLNSLIRDSSKISIRPEYFVLRDIDDFLSSPNSYVQE